MLIKFEPKFSINSKIKNYLKKIEEAKKDIQKLPITVKVLNNLRQTARLVSTHYSTMIEGNKLTQNQVDYVVSSDKKYTKRQRDEYEVKGYYHALCWIEKLAAKKNLITEKIIQTLHAIVMGGGKTNVKPTFYRDGQNIIKDMVTGAIVYLPPEAKDVKALMGGLIDWINKNKKLSTPIIAAIVHYQFVTIHPYYDGNGRTARLLTSLVLHSCGYGLKGIYSLDQYYAQDLGGYYQAISVGPSHNYYMGRAESDVVGWIEYFCKGMASAFGNVKKQAVQAAKSKQADKSSALNSIDPKQRKVLGLFEKNETITAKQVAKILAFKQSSASRLCSKWSDEGFLVIADFSKRNRSYKLATKFKKLFFY